MIKEGHEVATNEDVKVLWGVGTQQECVSVVKLHYISEWKFQNTG